MSGERIPNHIEFYLVAKNAGKVVLDPCNDCKLDPLDCGKAVTSLTRDGLDCELYQKPIMLNGLKPAGADSAGEIMT